jgi:hypothetical protein
MTYKCQSLPWLATTIFSFGNLKMLLASHCALTFSKNLQASEGLKTNRFIARVVLIKLKFLQMTTSQ